MDPTERIIAVVDGEELDRVQTLSVLTDLQPVYQVLGRPLVQDGKLLSSWLGRTLLDRWGTGWLGRALVRDDVNKTVFKCLKAAVKLGFDAAWTVFAPVFSCAVDHRTVRDDWGSYNELVGDGFGNSTYQYREPAIQTPEGYDAWTHFPDPVQHAQLAFELYKKALKMHGKDICICGEVVSDMFDRIFLALGMANLARYIRKEPGFIRDFIKRLEEYSIETTKAMMDAGVQVVLKGDDMGYHDRPLMKPSAIDEFWGPSYTRLCKLIHKRGGKFFLHSCGDNTELFDYFIKWGIDGGHAFETTSNVDILREKELHGDKFTIIGGVGVDYLLTKQSKDEEVVEKVRELVERLGPGGRFILAPAHSLPIVDMEKERLMIETARGIHIGKK
ncbi:MAG: uroporphyrinogen decarboxylase family protein [Candidatus Hodarchaeota archaeon]